MRSDTKLQTPFTTWTNQNYSQWTLPWLGFRISLRVGGTELRMGLSCNCMGQKCGVKFRWSCDNCSLLKIATTESMLWMSYLKERNDQAAKQTHPQSIFADEILFRLRKHNMVWICEFLWIFGQEWWNGTASKLGVFSESPNIRFSRFPKISLAAATRLNR